MRLIAEQTIEQELQEMRRNYIPESPKSKVEKQKTLISQLGDQIGNVDDYFVEIDGKNPNYDTGLKSVFSD